MRWTFHFRQCISWASALIFLPESESSITMELNKASIPARLIFILVFLLLWNSECRRIWQFWTSAPRVAAPACACSYQLLALWFWLSRYGCWLNTCDTNILEKTRLSPACVGSKLGFVSLIVCLSWFSCALIMPWYGLVFTDQLCNRRIM